MLATLSRRPSRYLLFLSAAAGLSAIACATWPPPSESHGISVVAGETHLGEQGEVTCTRVRTCDIDGLQVVVTPRCNSASPLKVRVEVRTVGSNALDTLLAFPVRVSLSANQEHRQFIPLFMTPADGATVWVRVSADCDNRKDQVWASTNCRFTNGGK